MMEYDLFCEQLSVTVSRETFHQLVRYHDLLLTWQARINLISPATIPFIWERHILDSAQLFSHTLPNKLMDIGSGAGLPGIILAIMGHPAVTLVESDQRKAIFLKEVARELGLTVHIENRRIEAIPPSPYPTITARACAALDQLLIWAAPFMCKDSICLFAKGANYAMEIEDARRHWDFTLEIIPSITQPEAALLHISHLQRGAHATDSFNR